MTSKVIQSQFAKVIVDQEISMQGHDDKKNNSTLCMLPRKVDTKQSIPTLIKAIRSGYSVRSVRVLIQTLSICEINAKDDLGRSALMHVVEFPIVHTGVDNIQLPVTRETWCYDMSKLLLEYRANPHICNFLEENAQTIAVKTGLLSVRELLDSWTDRIECVRLLKVHKRNQTQNSMLFHMPDDVLNTIFKMLWNPKL